ncbi:hypothetical protein FRC04_004071 [Tulasnella sp. 424]|nr:hypothetical protein FRC04_004071 [Tulasnella sp. 424]
MMSTAQDVCPSILAGGLLVAGQLQVTAEDGDTIHSAGQKRSIRKRYKTFADLPGYWSLKSDDRNRVKEFIGWIEDAQGTPNIQSNNSRADGKIDAKGKGKVKESDRESQGSAPRGSRRHAETRPISPEPSQSWFGNVPSWDDPEPPKALQETARVNKKKEKEEVNKQEGRRNARSEAHLEPVPPQPGTASQANNSRKPKPPSNQDSRDAKQAISQAPELRLEVQPTPAPSGPPEPPKAEIDQTVVMRLELEDAEAVARLAEAELLLVETRVKVESARRAIIAQKLKMARAGVAPKS